MVLQASCLGGIVKHESTENNHHKIKSVFSRVQGLRLRHFAHWQDHARGAARLNVQRLLAVPGWRAQRTRIKPLDWPENWQDADWTARQDAASGEKLNYKGLFYSSDSKDYLSSELFGNPEQLDSAEIIQENLNNYWHLLKYLQQWDWLHTRHALARGAYKIPRPRESREGDF